jgi:hypothetical protein
MFEDDLTVADGQGSGWQERERVWKLLDRAGTAKAKGAQRLWASPTCQDKALHVVDDRLAPEIVAKEEGNEKVLFSGQ